jgi:hypothetical protein
MGKAVTGLESNPVTAHEINNNNGIMFIFNGIS